MLSTSSRSAVLRLSSVRTRAMSSMLGRVCETPLATRRPGSQIVPAGSTKYPLIYSRHNLQASRSIFIQTADTPNPESLKFVPTGRAVLESKADSDDGDLNGYYVTKNDPANDILRSPLAKKLLDIEGVKAVYLGLDFVTVTKYPTGKWKLLRPSIFETIMTWAESDQPALLDRPEITDTTILDTDDEIVAMIKELIEARIRPAVQEDGGDIRYVGFDEETGLVTVELAGSCVGCPSSAVTLKQGVENMLMHYIPEVTAVVALEEEDTAKSTDSTSDASDTSSSSKQKSYEERLAAAGIPFAD
jgi:NFU1 iron-sulfur cluster scaffold homolog, mitochondrial